MNRKLTMACIALAAFAAFVIAPAASASPVLTHEGKVVPKGTKIIITLKGGTNAVFTSPVTVTCSKAFLTGEVTKNESNVVEGKIAAGSANFGNAITETVTFPPFVIHRVFHECSSNLFGAPTAVTVNSALCLKVSASPADTVVTTGCGANVVFTLNLTGNGPCKYSTASVSGTFTTGSHSITMSEQEAKKIEGGVFCPSNGKLDMTFEAFTEVEEKEAGSPLTLS